MRNEIPATFDGTNIIFTQLGQNEDLDMTINLETKEMTFERVFFDEECEEWDGVEVYCENIEDEMSKHCFLSIAEEALTIRQLKAMFSHKMSA